jgi:HEAT repeat protein
VGIKLVDDPRGLRMRWSDESPERLVARLDDERFVVRERAIEELERRGVSALAALTAGLQAPSANVRRNVVWALTRIDDDGCRRAVVSALGDPDNAVVLAALHSSGLWRYAPARTRMVDLLESNEPSIRREAACALGRLKDPSAVPFLIDALNQRCQINKSGTGIRRSSRLSWMPNRSRSNARRATDGANASSAAGDRRSCIRTSRA